MTSFMNSPLLFEVTRSKKCLRYSYRVSLIRRSYADKEWHDDAYCIFRKQSLLNNNRLGDFEKVLFSPLSFCKFWSMRQNSPLAASLQECVFDETICAELDAHEKVTKANFFAGPSPLSHFKKFAIGLIVTFMIVTLVIVTPWWLWCEHDCDHHDACFNFPFVTFCDHALQVKEMSCRVAHYFQQQGYKKGEVRK